MFKKLVMPIILVLAVFLSACGSKEPVISQRTEMVKEQVEQLELDQYPELKLEAAILERKAILAGESFKINIKISNNGDKTVMYTKGSGSSTTPDALYAYVEGMQTVIPEDKIGPLTMDMRYEALEPGDSISFDYTIMAIEPDEEFDNHTYDVYAEDGSYIADKSLQELNELYPELKAVKKGSYAGHVYFQYSVVGDESEENAMIGNPTAYSTAEITVGIS